MDKKTGKVEVPDEGQPIGKDYPPRLSDVESEKEVHLVEGSNAYENLPETDDGVEEAGPFRVPDNDLAGEGWTPPTSPGGGWVHPAEAALEERLEEEEGL